MRSLWSGALSFGLINIPVNLYPATFDRGINLDMLHKKDLSPIRFARFCKLEDKEIPYDEIVKGYEYEKGQYIVLTEEDFIKASPKRTKTLEIELFIDEGEVDPIYYEKPYLLEPGKGASKTYVLLNEALKKSRKVGLATYILHTKPHIGLIKPHGRGILLQQLRFHSDLRNFAEIELPVAKIQSKELEIAVKLIDQLTEDFHPEKFKDTYTEELQSVIDQKTKGIKPSKKKGEPEKITAVGDIMKQLKASLTKYHHSHPRTRGRSKARTK